MVTTSHRWKFYRSAGVDQVAIESGEDLVHLRELDPKLWLALSMPTKSVELDARTLELLDRDRDGFVRLPEILEAVDWTCAAYRDPDSALAGSDGVRLDELADGPVLAGARRLLANLGTPDAARVTLADATNAEQMFVDTRFNGDGVVPAEIASAAARDAIEAMLATHGAATDRSGRPGVDAARIDAFFADARALVAWHAAADVQVLPLGDRTAAAAGAVRAVRAKVDDFFTRCRVAAFDARAAIALNPPDAELAALATKELSPTSVELAHLPIARIKPHDGLPLVHGINPGWQERVARLAADAVAPLIGARDTLGERDWQQIVATLEPYERWRAAQPTAKLDALAIERVRNALSCEAEIRSLLAQDLAVKPEVDAIADVERLCRYRRDLPTVLDNFVNFSRFYDHRDGVFQAGTLYLDGRACKLVVEVLDVAKHSAMAAMSGAFLAYCECVRIGEPKKLVAAAFTAGDVDNLFVGRNGVFIDRKGRDWQATITKVIDSPISLRQAFWQPYRKLVRAIEERVAKRASAKETDVGTKLDTAAAHVTTVDKPVDKTAPPPKPVGTIDLGTVAALGVAVGGIATVVTAVLSGVFGLGKWAPLGIAAVMLAISLPSMVLAYLKLRRRNLGPLLDANGWAINVLTRITVPFGTSLTERARLPAGAKRVHRRWLPA